VYSNNCRTKHSAMDGLCSHATQKLKCRAKDHNNDIKTIQNIPFTENTHTVALSNSYNEGPGLMKLKLQATKTHTRLMDSRWPLHGLATLLAGKRTSIRCIAGWVDLGA
jgi:hypothetical protein